LAHEIFARADRNGTKLLDRGEIKQIFKDLQIYAKKKKINEIIDRYDYNKDGNIDFDEFKILVKELLRKEELVPIFKRYSPGWLSHNFSEPSMTLLQLHQFFQNEQKQELTLDELRGMNEKFKDIHPTQPCISFDLFNDLLFSMLNTIFNAELSTQYQDMTRPLTDYYVNSSHNTYLLSNQLTGESSVHAYIQALLKGCRCVELDLWNGPNSEPIIYHGHTMTSKILFADVISALKEHAFKKCSYPLILSFEMHCDLKGQEKVAQILQEKMGDMIYCIPENNQTFKYFPSPESLKEKFVIKGKGKVKKPGENGARAESHLSPPLDLKLEVEDKQKAQPEQNQLNKSVTAQHLSVLDSSIDSQLDTLGDSPIKSGYEMTEGDVSPKARAQSKFEDDDDQIFSRAKNHNLSSTLLSINRPLFQPGKSLQVEPTTPAPIGLNPKTNTSVIIRFLKDDEEAVMTGDDSFEKDLGNRLSDKMKKMKRVNYFKGRPGVAESRSDSMKSNRSQESQRRSSPALETVLNGSIANVKKRLETPALVAKKAGKGHTIKILPQLNALYGMIGCKMHLQNERTIWHISSIDENKINKLFKNHHKELIGFHRKYLSRIYPSASRIDSSNYDPITSWAAGSQLVALNFQTYDEAMLLNYAKFAANGGAGYVLKPKYLRHNSDSDPDYHPKELNKKPVKKLLLKIISGQQIRPDKFNSKEIIDPYVEIKIRGLEIDEHNNSTYRTQTVKDNGFHPVWSKKDHPNVFQFDIYAPDFCFLVFNIFDEDMVGRDKMGWYAIEFNHIQQGYRVIPILNNRCQPINHSYVFCHISIETL